LESPRARQRGQWLADTLDTPDFRLGRASEDASFRSYWRVDVGGETRILMDAPPDKEDITSWLDIGARLDAAGLHAPRVFASDAGAGFVLMEDLGTRTYLGELVDARVDVLYADALDALLRMQTAVDVRGMPAYDEARLRAEMDLLPAWFLVRHLGFRPDADDAAVIADAFAFLVQSALEQPAAFVHRDYHSRNLLVTDAASPGIIDFQDAHIGPITYDLVSLLRDCYIAWEPERVAGWVDAHRQRLLAAHLIGADTGAARFQRWFDLMGLQRHLKVLGIFCRLWYRDGKGQYLGDLPLVWHYVADVASRYPELAAFAALLERARDARDLTRPHPPVPA
jgi:N-acetylmuramate 1-kinase